VPVGNAAGDPFSSWLNPTSIVIGALAVLTGAYLAAVYMAGDARRAGLPDLERTFRDRALGAGVVTGALAIGALFVVRDDARSLYDALTSGTGLALVLASAVCGAATLALVWGERFELARVSAAGAVTCIIVGWAVAQRPYLLPGHLTVEQAAASHRVLEAMLISLGVGFLVLVPSLALLYRLVLQGRLDKDYEPLGQRFEP
jgi:cytochrome d ubiquinol oxidase subunit II